MNKKLKLSTILIIILTLFFVGCGGDSGGGGGNNGDDDIDITPPTVLTVNPVSGSTIRPTSDIVITFSESMDTDTVTSITDLGLEADSKWSTTTHENDTLTVSPFSEWNAGIDRTLDIDCLDINFNPMEQLNLTYTVEVEDTVPPTAAANPVSGSSIYTTDNSVITFSESMDTGSLELSGDLSSEADFTWSTTTHENDTLTISPFSGWSEGVDLTLDIDCKDTAGNEMEQFNLFYSIENSWPGTRLMGTDKNDQATEVATDSSGNIYVTGYTEGGLDGNTYAGYFDIFLVKYNSSGEKQWTRQMGTDSDDRATGVATDSSGNIYVTGFTEGDLDGNANAGESDIFLAKFDSSGKREWTRLMGTDKNDSAAGAVTDSSGNIYITGYTEGGLDGNTYAGYFDIFLAKYNSSGEKQWTRQMGTDSNDLARGVATDSSGNIYATGLTYGSLDGNTNAGTKDIFLVKYNTSGVKQWTRQMGTASEDTGFNVTTDSSGNIYITGDTKGGLDGNINAGAKDVFLIKYNSSGEKQWTRQMGTVLYDFLNGVSVDSAGNIYAVGSTQSDFDGNRHIGSYDIILLKYNSSGEKQWTRQMGTLRWDYAHGVSLDSSDNIYITGYTGGGLDGNINMGGSDLFLLKYNSSGEKQ